jgi:carbon monoxide dehydrogenase subunit G
MASIRREITIDAPADTVWAAIRDVGNAHHLFAGVLSDSRLDGDARVVTFANGFVTRELIVDIDDEARRFAYAATGGRLAHHNASMQVFPDGDERCRFVWITDLLPNDAREDISTLVDRGISAMKRHLDRPLPRRMLEK